MVKCPKCNTENTSKTSQNIKYVKYISSKDKDDIISKCKPHPLTVDKMPFIKHFKCSKCGHEYLGHEDYGFIRNGNFDSKLEDLEVKISNSNGWTSIYCNGKQMSFRQKKKDYERINFILKRW